DCADIYLAATGDKRADRAHMTKWIKDPDNVWTTTPQNSMKFAAFMHKVGTVKRLAGDWKEMFLPEAQGLKGS
ncbi:MAG: ABC transporter substrate-binding protein, partial [Proteobacteria bacterium]|nr:ABC transporter substrate-binding protein [Pseudomonadota bacterium]